MFLFNSKSKRQTVDPGEQTQLVGLICRWQLQISPVHNTTRTQSWLFDLTFISPTCVPDKTVAHNQEQGRKSKGWLCLLDSCVTCWLETKMTCWLEGRPQTTVCLGPQEFYAADIQVRVALNKWDSWSLLAGHVIFVEALKWIHKTHILLLFIFFVLQVFAFAHMKYGWDHSANTT